MLSLAASRGSSLPSAVDQLETRQVQPTATNSDAPLNYSKKHELTRLSSELYQRSHILRPRCPRRPPATQEILMSPRQTADSLKQTRVTSSMYCSRSRAFLKSYSLARLLSSQMYSCRRRSVPQVKSSPASECYLCTPVSHLDEAVSVEQRHGVGVLLLLLQQLPGQSLLMQQEALLLHDL